MGCGCKGGTWQPPTQDEIDAMEARAAAARERRAAAGGPVPQKQGITRPNDPANYHSGYDVQQFTPA